VAKDGNLLVDCPHLAWPADSRSTVHLGKTLAAADFEITAPEGANRVHARVIGVVENQAPTEALEADLPVVDGVVEGTGGVAQIALVERHRATGGVVNGFVSGFGYQGRMAMASTVAHDSHHMIVVGTDRANMAAAANRLGEVGGGVTVWKDGVEIALVELPIADRMVAAMAECGCSLNNAYMQHSLLALVVIPSLRISDLGLVDVDRFELTELLGDSN
jgi:adenine deaminase